VSRYPHVGWACQWCGASHSRFGLGLWNSVFEDGRVASVGCIECGIKKCRNWFPLNMKHVFEMVDRVPWVATEMEAKLFAWWHIDEWFAPRETVW